MPVTDEVTSDLDIVPYALYPEEYNSAKEGLVTPVKNQSFDQPLLGFQSYLKY